MSVPYRKSKDGITLEVRVQPRSSRAGIEGVEGRVLRVRLTAPPHGGEANAQLLRVLARELGLRKSSLSIIKGQASRNKVVEARGVQGLPERP
ncbi:MAG: DUF167 domain-containing protein [Nitrospirota bacterium]